MGIQTNCPTPELLFLTTIMVRKELFPYLLPSLYFFLVISSNLPSLPVLAIDLEVLYSYKALWDLFSFFNSCEGNCLIHHKLNIFGLLGAVRGPECHLRPHKSPVKQAEQTQYPH